jgi:hypothetical protein
MSTMANVVLADSVPANHTFVPVSPYPVSIWEDRTTPITGLGTAALSGSVKRAAKSNEVNRVKINLNVPVEETSTDTGVTTVTGNLRINLDAISPANSTALQRLDVLTMFRAAIDLAIVEEMIEDLIQPS